MALHVLDEANRCLGCKKPLCQEGCPIHTNIPEVIRLLKANQMDAAGRMLFENNPLTTVCSLVCNHENQCEGHCIRNRMPSHDPVHFSIIEDYISTTYANKMTAGPAPKNGMKAAVVGSGPSGLAVADRLNHRGHSVTVLEREDRPGGLLMYGIPNMKLDKSVIARRIALMESEGVEFRVNTNVGLDVTPKELKEEFDAVVLCCGSKTPRSLNVPGMDAQGVWFAVDYLTAATKKVIGITEDFAITAKDRHVVIVGGGDTGNDCVGTAIRQGCASVTQLEMMGKPPATRQPSNPWPQWPKVLKTDYGQQEAIARFGSDPRRYQTTVKEILCGEDGAVHALRTVRLEPKTENGQTQMQPVPESEEEIPCDLLLIAAGFTGVQDYVAQAFDLPRDNRGNLLAVNYHTPIDHIFAAGDCRRGQSLVVWGIAEGRACAKEVDRYLMGYTNMM